MADSADNKTESSAEKAYAAAAGAASEKTIPADDSAAPVEFPAKTKRAAKPDEASQATAKAATIADPAPAAQSAAAAGPVPAVEPRQRAAVKPAGPKGGPKRGAAKSISAKSTPAKSTPAKSTPAKSTPAKAAQAKAVPVKPVPAKASPTRSAPGKVAPMANRKPDSQKIKTAAKPATTSVASPVTLISQLKEIPMDITSSISDAVSGAQEKAKETFTKTSAAASEYGEFAKGNVQACVESGKILASGLQEMGSKMVADSKSVFETATADMKALGGIKSPSDFFKLQSDILRRNFETAISYGSKNSEAMLKLTNEVIAPLSGRVTLAVEKIKKAA